MLRRARLLALLLPLLMLMCAPAGRPAAAQDATSLTLLFDTHLHGYLTAAGDVSFAHYAGLVRERRAAAGRSLFLGGGDTLGASQMSSVFKGAQMVEAFNAAGLDADTFGNHEFDYGPDNLVERVRASRFPWVSANVRDRRTGAVFAAEAGARPYVVLDAGGLMVGVTGAAWQFTSATNAGPDVEVVDAAAALREVVPQMRAAGARVVVVIVHMSIAESEAIARAVDGIDVIVGNHEDQPLAQPVPVGGAIIARSPADYKGLGELTLRLADGRPTGFEYVEHKVTKDSPQDEAVAAIVARYQDDLKARLQAPVGRADTALDARTETVRAKESNLGNYLADALRAWGNADVALMNGGGIRGNKEYGPGVLTREDVVSILPFNNTAALLRISGADLLAALENGVSRSSAAETATGLPGRFPQTSGLRFTVDTERPAGSRVLSVEVGGAPLDPARLYLLATNNFLADGGDGYDALKGAEVVISGQAGPLLTDVLTAAIERDGAVAPAAEGRIIFAPAGAGASSTFHVQR